MSGRFSRILFVVVAAAMCGKFVFAATPAAFETGAEIQARLERQVALPEPDTDDSFERCVFLHQRGWAYNGLGNYDKAFVDLKQALALSPPDVSLPVDWCMRWRVQNDLSRVLFASGDYFAHIDFLESVGTELLAKGSLRSAHGRRYLVTRILMVSSYLSLGMFQAAEAAFESATAVLKELPGSENWGNEQYNMQDIYNMAAAQIAEARGDIVTAEQYRRSSLMNAEQYVVNRSRKNNPPLIRLTRENQTRAVMHLAANLAVQGRTGESRHLVEEVLAQTLSRDSFFSVNTSNVLSVLGDIELHQGRLDEALRYFDLSLQALEGSAARPYSIALAKIRDRLGLIHGMQGRWEEALAVYRLRDEGLRSNPEQAGTFTSETIDWAMSLLRNGNADQAFEMLQRMWHAVQARPFADPLEAVYAQGYLGIVESERGERKAALALFKKALPALLKYGNEAGEGDNAKCLAVYRVRTILEGYLDLLARLHASGEVPPDVDVASEAFTVADLARNSSVQRAVTASAARAAVPDARLAQLIRREQDAASQIRSLNRILDRLASDRKAEQLQSAMKDIQHDIDRLRQEHAVHRKQLAERYPDYADLVAPKPVAIADVQKTLKADEAVVSIYSGRSKTFVWTVTQKGLAFRVIPVAKDDLAQSVKAVLRSLDFADGKIKPFDAETAHQLFALLLGPDAALWSRGKLINVIPHGVLGQLPFAALLTEPVGKAQGTAYADWPWLIGKIAIAQQPSASALVALRTAALSRREQKPFVGFGDPLFMADAQPAAQRGLRFRKLSLAPQLDDALNIIEQARKDLPIVRTLASQTPVPLAQIFSRLPALPDTAEELNEIAVTLGANPETDLFLGARATESNVKATDLSRYRIVAFATHGLLPEGINGLDQPALALANPALTGDDNNDGLLSLDEVLGLKLNADWVVLSACDTASTDGSGAEAASGLGRAFFFAGARSLLLSNWAVETGSARLLTTGLFSQQKNHPAMMRAEALRQSMLDVMNSDIEDYSHPLFWAPFSLMGDGTSADGFAR